MAIQPLSDQYQLLGHMAAGDGRAFKIIYDHYYNTLFAYGLYLVKSEELTEELIQETFLKLWMQGEKAIHILNLESFLVTVIRNLALNVLRRHKLEVLAGRQRAAEWSESHNETEEGILLSDGRRILQRGIDQLTPQQKQVYQLCYQQGMKYHEAAEALGLSTATVQSYMKAALKSLREFMSKNSDLAALAILFKLF